MTELFTFCLAGRGHVHFIFGGFEEANFNGLIWAEGIEMEAVVF